MAETLLAPVVDTTLSNGLRFVGEPSEQSQGVALAIRIPAGSKDDPGNKLGLANLVKDTLFLGTRQHDARALSDAFDFFGICHSAYTGTECTTFQVRLLPEHLGQCLALLREIFSAPAFVPQECETAKLQAVQELKHLEDEPLGKLFLALKELYFGSAWGHAELGREDTIPELERGDIEAFWQAHYIPAGALVAASGRFEPDALRAQLETLFSNSGERWAPEAPPAPPQERAVRHISKNTAQTQMALAFPCVRRSDPASYAAQVALGVLSGGMSSRLFSEVREKRALAYAVGAEAVSFRGTGVIYAYAGASASSAAETLQVLKAELKNLGAALTEEEVNRAKAGFKAQLLMDQESTIARARELLDSVYYEDRVVPLDEVVQKINAVTAAAVAQYWAAHPIEPYALVTLGREALET